MFFFEFFAKNRFAVCPVPMNKEQEEMIKEQERNKEEMEEIMREIEILKPYHLLLSAQVLRLRWQ